MRTVSYTHLHKQLSAFVHDHRVGITVFLQELGELLPGALVSIIRSRNSQDHHLWILSLIHIWNMYSTSWSLNRKVTIPLSR